MGIKATEEAARMSAEWRRNVMAWRTRTEKEPDSCTRTAMEIKPRLTTEVRSRVKAEETAVDSQEVAAERDAVPDAGLQEIQAGVGIYRGSAFLEDGHYAAEDVASGTMFAADGAIPLHNSLVTIQLDNAVENISAGDTEKDNVSYGQRAGIGQGFQFHGIPVPTYEGEHANALDGNGYILAFAEDTEDFREKYVIADNYFLHNCLPVYLPD